MLNFHPFRTTNFPVPIQSQVEFECHDGHPSDLRYPSGVFQQEVAVVQSITGKVLSCTKWKNIAGRCVACLPDMYFFFFGKNMQKNFMFGWSNHAFLLILPGQSNPVDGWCCWIIFRILFQLLNMILIDNVTRFSGWTVDTTRHESIILDSFNGSPGYHPLVLKM